MVKREVTKIKLLCLVSIIMLSLSSCLYDCGDWISYNQNYRIKVSKFYQYKGAICVNDSFKIGLAYNNDKPYPKKLYESVKIGDSIIAEANNDTIYVIRDNEIEWFFKYGVTGRNGKYGVSR